MVGDTLSEIVTLDEANAILPRLRALAGYLASRHSYWRRYWTGSDLRWDRVMLVGHSQGAGHVAFLAKLVSVKRVIMTGGPHDVGPNGAGTWLSAPGATPLANYRSLLHRDDFFGAASQLAAVRLLMGQDYEPTMVDRSVPADAGPVLMATMAHRDPHNSLQREEFVGIWRWLLGER
jgi:pimeloyl-ACP methyl ester carboxylesterase